MKPDDELCLCFHVTFRKVINFARVEKIRQASQLSNCFGAGTGCGWCRKTLQRIGDRIASEGPPAAEQLDDWLEQFRLDRSAYSSGRDKYRDSQKDEQENRSFTD